MEYLTWLYSLAASTFIFIALYFVLQNQRKLQPLPPGPWSLPVIGHLHLLKNPLYRTLGKLSAQYGPVFGLKLGYQYTVVVSSPAAFEECFTKNDVVLADRPHNMAAKYLNYDGTTIGATNYNDNWRYGRRISNQELFSVSRQNMFQSLRQDEVKSMISSLFRATRQGKQKVEMKSRISNMSFNIIVKILVGKRFSNEGGKDSPEGRAFQEIIREMFEVSAASNPSDFLPFLRLNDYGGYEKKMVKLGKRVDAVLQNFIDERRAKKGGLDGSMLSNMLSQDAHSGSISDTTIKSLIIVSSRLNFSTTETNAC